MFRDFDNKKEILRDDKHSVCFSANGKVVFVHFTSSKRRPATEPRGTVLLFSVLQTETHFLLGWSPFWFFSACAKTFDGSGELFFFQRSVLDSALLCVLWYQSASPKKEHISAFLSTACLVTWQEVAETWDTEFVEKLAFSVICAINQVFDDEEECEKEEQSGKKETAALLSTLTWVLKWFGRLMCRVCWVRSRSMFGVQPWQSWVLMCFCVQV